MSIEYEDSESFHEGIYQLVRKGLTFHANHKTLKVTLLGGY